MNSNSKSSLAVRRALVQRRTNETQIEVELLLDGSGQSDIQTDCHSLIT